MLIVISSRVYIEIKLCEPTCTSEKLPIARDPEPGSALSVKLQAAAGRTNA